MNQGENKPKNRITGLETERQGPAITIDQESSESQKSQVQTHWGRYLAGFVGVVIIAALGYTGYHYWQNRQIPPVVEEPGDDFRVLDNSALKSKLPFPEDVVGDSELIKAINLYRSGYMPSARSIFQNIVDSGKEPEVKSYALVYLGAIADDEGRYNLAIDYYNRAIKFFPRNFYAHYNMAIAFRHKGMYPEALEELKLARKIRPDLVDIGILKGEIEFETSDFPAAEETLKGVVEKQPDALAYYNLGIVYKKQGEFAQAKSAFLRAMEVPGSPEAVYKAAAQIGIIYGTQGDYANAEVYFRKALTLQPKNPKYHYNLALVRYKAGDTEGAIASLKESMKYGSENPKTYMYISKLYEKLGRDHEAEESLRKAAEAAPMDVVILNQLSDVLIKNGKWSDAVATLKKILNISPNILDRSHALYNLGNVYMEIGDYDSSKKALEKAHNLDSVNEGTLLALGNLYHLQGDSHKTIDLYKEALKINPDATAILKALGILYYKLGLYSEAEGAFLRLEAHSGKKGEDSVFIHHAMGKIRKKRKDYGEALNYFNKALVTTDIDMKFNVLMDKADTILLADMPSIEALEALEKAISLKPESYEVRLLLARALVHEGSVSARQRAEEELSSVVQLASEPSLLSKAYTLRGIIFYKQGFYLKSLDDFNTALEFDPANEEAFQNKKAASMRLESQY